MHCMMKSNLHHLIEEQADREGESPALSYKKETLTYAELWSKVIGVASGLAAMGVGSGDRVAVFLEKRIETVAAELRRFSGGLRLRADQSGPQTPAGRLHSRRLRCSRAHHHARAVEHPGRGARTLPSPGACRADRRRGGQRRPIAAPATYCCTTGRSSLTDLRALPSHLQDRRRHRGDPLHLGQHRQAQGGRAQSSQLDRPVPRASATTSAILRTTSSWPRCR